MSFPDKKMSAPLAATGETHEDKTPVQTRAELIEICQGALDRQRRGGRIVDNLYAVAVSVAWIVC